MRSLANTLALPRELALALALALAIAIAGKPASAQDQDAPADDLGDVFDRGCGDDDGTDRCSPVVQAQMYAEYGIAAPSELLEENITVRRAMFVDGYGNDVAAIAFSRAPGESPVVEVFTPGSQGPNQPAPLRAFVSEAVWQDVMSSSRDFDEELARELPQVEAAGAAPPPPPLRICLHAWFVVAEAVDAPRVRTNALAGTGSAGQARDPSLPVIPSMRPGAIRSDAEGACADGLAMRYAFELADLAHAALAECSTLDQDNFRTIASLLARCRYLSGDRLVAGEASQLAQEVSRALSSAEERELRWLFVGSGNARADRFRSAIAGGTLYFGNVTGLDYDRAQIAAQLYFPHEYDDMAEVADLTINLLRQSRGFKIDTFTVGERRLANPAE